ncbi:MAG: hypothetical protein JST32_02570 [Bacteroidetes bacterium]|nr:hypothetical protein [Bacteroidota bacterium]
MKIKILILCLFIQFTSCTTKQLYGYKDLGNHYFLWEDDHSRHSIIWCQNDKNIKLGGALVIGMTKDVTKYSCDNRYIFIETLEYNDSKQSLREFWIIDKLIPINFSKENWKDKIINGPLDSISFVSSLPEGSIKNNFLK